MDVSFHVVATLGLLAVAKLLGFPVSFQSLVLAFAFGVLIDCDHILAYWIFSKESFSLDLLKIRRWYLEKIRIQMAKFHFLHGSLVASIITIILIGINEYIPLTAFLLHLILDQCN